MGRNLIARPLLSIGLLAASLAWLGFTLQRTAFDASRTERAVGVLLDDQTVRAALLQRLADNVDTQLPPAVRNQVTTEQLATVAAATLDDPQVRAALVTAIGGTHRYLLGETDAAPAVDQALVDTVLRQQLLGLRPDLAPATATAPPFGVELPVDGLGPVRSARSFVDAATPLAAIVALGCIAAALVLSPNRPRVLRRVGWWAMATGAFWVALRFLLPAFTNAVLPSGAALIGGLTEALVGAVMGPGVVLAAAGAGLWAAGMLLGRVDLGPATAGETRAARERSTARARSRAEGARSSAAARRDAGQHAADAGPGGWTTVPQPLERRRGSRRSRSNPLVRAAQPATQRPDDAGLYVPPVRQPASMYPAADHAADAGLAGRSDVRPGDGAAPPALVHRTAPDQPTPYPAAGGTPFSSPAGPDASVAPTAALPLAPIVPGSLEHRGGSAADGGPVGPTGLGATRLPAGGVPLPKRPRTGPAPLPDPGALPDERTASALRGAMGAPVDPGGPVGSSGAAPGGVDDRSGARPSSEWLGGFSLDPHEHRRVADPAPPPPRWVQGVGYVYDEPPTADARWVDGLGYVIDEP